VMACVAGDLTVPVKTILIDRTHHHYHLARDQFRFLIVLLEMILNVAKSALDSQGSRDKLHAWNDLIRRNVLQDLNVLEMALGRCAG
jgi:hypothetical protein